MDLDKETIENFRLNLSTIRRFAGWSSAHLAEILGVSRATIINLENQKYKMTKMQYLAISKLFELEIEENNNEILASLINLLIKDKGISDQYKEELRKNIELKSKKIGFKNGSGKIGEILVDDLDPNLIKQGKKVVDQLLLKNITTGGLKNGKKQQ